MTIIEFAIACFRGIVWLGVVISVLLMALLLLIGAFSVIDPSIRASRAGDAIDLLVYSPIVLVGGQFAIGIIFGGAALLLGIYDAQREILAALKIGNASKHASLIDHAET